ncbi:MAG: hypothetical protein ABR920_02135 [Terriglobales bacterium]
MADPFESSHRKIARAKEHFLNLHREIEKFTLINPYERVIEPHPNKPDHVVHKIKMTKEIPASIADTTADLVQNLRNALDNAAYAVAVATGKTAAKNAAFPFARSVTEMANSLGRSKDLPKEIQSLFCGFQPYLGGDDILWALNEICNGDKHKMVIPVGTAIVRLGASVQGTGGYFRMPDPHVWDRTKNEMVLITFGPKTEFKYDFNFGFFVVFNDIQIVDGKPILGVLDELCGKVERIVMCIEAESRRLRFIK